MFTIMPLMRRPLLRLVVGESSSLAGLFSCSPQSLLFGVIHIILLALPYSNTISNLGCYCFQRKFFMLLGIICSLQATDKNHSSMVLYNHHHFVFLKGTDKDLANISLLWNKDIIILEISGWVPVSVFLATFIFLNVSNLTRLKFKFSSSNFLENDSWFILTQEF